MTCSITRGCGLAQTLAAAGLRPTRQRLLLAQMLAGKGHCHVTAEMLHAEVKRARHKVSLATVYNTLHQFTRAGLLREVVVENGRAYFDTNTSPHHHILYEDTGELRDIPANNVEISRLPALPRGASLRRVDVIIRVAR